MYHQLCNQMLYQVLHHKNKGTEKFLRKREKELLTKNREKMLK